MVYLSGALLPKSSKSLCLRKEGMESPLVNLDFERGKSIKFWLKDNFGTCLVAFSGGPFLFSNFWGWGASQRRRPQDSERLWMENLIGLSLIDCGHQSKPAALGKFGNLSRVLGIRNSFFSQVLRSYMSFYECYTKFFGISNDFYLELNQNKFIKYVFCIPGTCILFFIFFLNKQTNDKVIIQ